MKFKSAVGRFVSAVTASAMIVAGFSVLPEKDVMEAIDTSAASAVVVDTTKTYQSIRGFGGINHPEWTGKDLTDAQRKTSFGNGDNELGLTVLRVFVNPNKNQWNLAVPTAKYVSDLGYTVFASPWEPPSSIAASGGTGKYQGKLHLPESNFAAYAEHLNDFGKYMKDQKVNLYSISVQNEPDYAAEWTAWTPDQTTSFIANYGDRITSTRLMSPETFQYGAWNDSRDYYTKILNNSKAMANCDVFATHFYGTPRNKMDFPALENSGKEIWMTEVYVPNSEADSANRWPEALDVGENIHNALVVGNMSVYTWWYIRRSYGLIDENGKPTKRGYNMAQFSKWVRPGDVRIDCTEQPNGDKVFVSAYKNNNKQVTIVAVNKGSEYNQVFNIGSGEKIKNVDRYRTTSSENLAATKNMAFDGSGFNAQLPANSISTFVITLEGSSSTGGNGGGNGGNTQTPTDPPASSGPDANGFYFRHSFEGTDNGWEGRGAATVLTSGRFAYDAKEALLVQDRTAGWNGAIYTLGSDFKAGESYSFSANATYADGDATRDFKLTLEYTNADGDTAWAGIATGTTAANQWVHLANTSFTLPAGGSNFKLIVETTDDTLENFYIDDVAAAVKGTKIDGAPAPNLPDPTDPPSQGGNNNNNNNSGSDFLAGDVNGDGRVDTFDLVAMRKGVISGFASDNAKYAADVNADGINNVADLVSLQKFLLGQGEKLEKPVVETPAASSKMRTISEYTPVVEKTVVESCPSDAQQNKGGVNYGKLEKKSYYSNFCGRTKPYNVLLPANYDKSKKYPVLYVMHGYWENQDRMIIEGNGTMYTQQIIGNAIAEGAAKEMIVVFPYIYSSKTQDNCSGMDDANNEAYDNFDTVLTTELMPLIEKEYSVATGRENTAITGFSMGGRESLNIGQKHPDLFGYVGSICAAPGATGAWKFESEEAAPSLIFMTAGGNDQTVYTTPEGYHKNFSNNNVPHIWHYFPAGYHGDNSIHAHIYNFVRAIFKA